MVAYAGSFVMMEETSEKTEKTEQSEEALHSVYHSKKFGKTILKGLEYVEAVQYQSAILSNLTHSTYYLPFDFNIHFIYHASYLELIG